MISICMIVKDEEKHLRNCLEAVKDLGCEIVITDTGSRDHTKDIALEYTDQVYEYEWTKDFSAARNFCISKATNDFIFTLDADEIVTDFHRKELLKQLLADQTSIGRVLRINEYTRNGEEYRYRERVNRVFNRKNYHYEGRIHEQLTAIDGLESITFLAPVEMTHSGYEGSEKERKIKTQRNIELLEQELKDNPNDPYYFFQLGKSYYMQEDYKKASEYFYQALSYDLDPELEYVIDMVESFGYSLINSNQYQRALELEGVYEAFCNSSDFVFLMGLIYMNNERFADAINQFMIATKMSNCRMEGCNSYLAYYNIGVIYECLGRLKEAKDAYERCGDYEAARVGITRVSKMLAEHRYT